MADETRNVITQVELNGTNYYVKDSEVKDWARADSAPSIISTPGNTNEIVVLSSTENKVASSGVKLSDIYARIDTATVVDTVADHVWNVNIINDDSSVDLSNYKTATQVDNAFATINDDIDSVEAEIDDLEAANTTLTSSVNSLSESVSTVSAGLEDHISQGHHPTALSQLTSDQTHRVVTDTQINAWNGIASQILDTESMKNYYTKEETITQILGRINSIPHFGVYILPNTLYMHVEELPSSARNIYTLYLELNDDQTENKNLYTEYLWTGTDFEMIGTQTLDLSGYDTSEEVDEKIDEVEADISEVQASLSDHVTNGSHPTMLSQLTGDTSHRVVSDSQIQAWNNLESNYLNTTSLVHYYTQEETVNQILSRINMIPHFGVYILPNSLYQSVNDLPSSARNIYTLYLELNSDPETSNLYTEYLWTGSAFEIIGTQTLDLTDYYDKNTVDGLLETAGSQSDWAENDSSENAYIKNRTHYEDYRTELLSKTWDGKSFNVTGSPTTVQTFDHVGLGSNGSETHYKIYKISDSITRNANGTYDFDASQIKIRYYMPDISINTVDNLEGVIRAVYAIEAPGATAAEVTEAIEDGHSDTYATISENNVYLRSYGDSNLELSVQLIYVLNNGTYDCISACLPNSDQEKISAWTASKSFSNYTYCTYNNKIYRCYNARSGDEPSGTTSDTTYWHYMCEQYASYTKGVYAVARFGDTDVSTADAWVPMQLNSVTKLNSQYLPDSLENRFTEIEESIDSVIAEVSIVISNFSVAAMTFSGTSTKTASEISALAESNALIKCSFNNYLNPFIVFVSTGIYNSQTAVWLNATTYESNSGMAYTMRIVGNAVTGTMASIGTFTPAEKTKLQGIAANADVSPSAGTGITISNGTISVTNPIYVGSGDMPDGYSVQIDPSGTSYNMNDYDTSSEVTTKITSATSSLQPKTMSQTIAGQTTVEATLSTLSSQKADYSMCNQTVSASNKIATMADITSAITTVLASSFPTGGNS